MIKFKLYFLFLFWILSQNYSFVNYGIEEGLSQVSIYSVFRDDEGFVWVGTEDGLNKFDAYTFKHYFRNPADSTTINDNTIQKIIAYDDNRILIGTQRGISIFDKNINAFISNPFKNYSEENTILELYKQENKDLWISSYENPLVLLKPGMDTVKYFQTGKKGFNFFYVNSVREDKEGTLWFGTEKGLYYRPVSQDTFIHVIKYKELFINDVFYDNELLYLATYNNFIKIYSIEEGKDITDIKLNGLNNKPARNKTIFKIIKDSKNKFWLGSEYDGLFILDFEDKESIHLKHSNFEKNSLINDYVYDLYIDIKSNIWIGTGKGLSLFDDHNMPFFHYSNSARYPDFLRDNSVWGIVQDKQNRIWVSSDGGVNVYQYESLRLSPVDVPNLKIPEFNTVDLYEDSRSNIWVISYNKGLYLYDSKIKNTINLAKLDKKLNSAFLIDVVEDAEGYFWIASNGNGLFKYDLNKKKVIHHYINTDTNKVILSNYILVSELTDDKNTLWTGHFEGLSELNIKTGEKKTYVYDKNDSLSLSYNIVYSVFQDSKSRIWIGTSFGLNLLDRKTGSFRSFYKKDGLENETIYAIEEDEFSNLWLSTNKGLSRLNTKSFTFTNFTMSDGLQSNEFNAGSSVKLKDGRMMFGGINGFNYFDPKEFYRKQQERNVSLVNFYVYNNEKRTNKHISQVKEIILPYEQNVFTIEFSSFNYSGVNDSKYRYILEGFDLEWTEVIKKNQVSYMNLDPGSYKFLIKAQSTHNSWSDEVKLLDIKIQSPFWMTWWFKSLLSFFILGFIYLGYRVRYRMIVIRKELLEDTVKKRTEELLNTLEELESAQDQLIQAEKLSSLGQMLAGIAHEMNTPLAYIINNISLSKRMLNKVNSNTSEDDLRLIKERMIKLLGQSLDGSNILKDLILGLRTFSRSDSEQKVNADLKEVFEKSLKLIEANTKDSEIIIEKQVEDNISIYCHPNQIGQVFVNLMNNACQAMISFRKKSKDEKISLLKITIYKKGDYVHILVSDNGGGISKEIEDKIFDPFFTTKDVGEGTGLGLSITYNIIKQHGGELKVESKSGFGCQFEVILKTI